jgi:hypothetical protein
MNLTASPEGLIMPAQFLAPSMISIRMPNDFGIAFIIVQALR